MIGLVMKSLFCEHFKVLKMTGLDSDAKDNDGGFMKNESGKARFLPNLEEPFSPDSYYIEGPYYQRYAIMYLFLIFARAWKTLN
jgi:hypothetical protein